MTTNKINHQLLSANGVKIYKIAGWSLFCISLMHFVFWSALTIHSWASWVSGDLWSYAAPKTLAEFELNFEFWALLGSFMVPLALLALLYVWAARKQLRLPGFLGWTLLLWVIACSLILGPSGFPLGLVPSILIVLANRREKRS